MKIIKYLNILLILFVVAFVTACNDKNIDEQPTNPTIGSKSEEAALDYIWFKVVNVSLLYKDINGNDVNVIEANIIKNFNQILNVETDYSKYINEISNSGKTLKLVISNTYNKYFAVGDEFLYKLNDTIQIKVDDKNEEVFSTLSNEYTLLPVADDELLLNNISSSIAIYTEKDYEMETLILQRVVHYCFDLENYFIEYDYSSGYSYSEKYSYVLTSNPVIVRFENMLKALNNINESFFYKLKYSHFGTMILNDPTINIEIDNYLKEMGV